MVNLRAFINRREQDKIIKNTKYLSNDLISRY